MKNFVTFDNAKEMLDFINDNHDLYCEDPYCKGTGVYVANYSDCGGIVTYYLSDEEVRECEKYHAETGDYWLGRLGPGGTIYDSSLHCGIAPNLDFCEQNYKKLWFVIC